MNHENIASTQQSLVKQLINDISSGKSLVKLIGHKDSAQIELTEQLISQLPSWNTLQLNATQFEQSSLQFEFTKLLYPNHKLKPKNSFELQCLIEQKLKQQLDGGNRTLLIVHDAQQLSDQAIEELRLIINLQCHQLNLLPTILIGLPALNKRLKQNQKILHRIEAGYTLAHAGTTMPNDKMVFWVLCLFSGLSIFAGIQSVPIPPTPMAIESEPARLLASPAQPTLNLAKNPPPPGKPDNHKELPGFLIKLMSFKGLEQKEAAKRMSSLIPKQLHHQVRIYISNDQQYDVFLGRFDTNSNARKYAKRLPKSLLFYHPTIFSSQRIGQAHDNEPVTLAHIQPPDESATR